MHDHIYSCLYIFTHITLSDATITDVGNFMIPRLPACDRTIPGPSRGMFKLISM